MQLKEKNALITGANRGIGRALAEQAARQGMHLHLLCRSESPEVVTQLQKSGAASVTAWDLDLAETAHIDAFLEKFSNSEFSPDLLINNAGQLTGGLLEEQDISHIYQMLQVNVAGLIHLTRGLLPNMLTLSEAKIVNNASVTGLMHLPCASTYSASKAAVIAFTESLRNELKGTSVSTMVMITPGVKTRMFDEIYDLYSGHLDLRFLSSIPAEDWAQRVFNHIIKDQSACWPRGSSYWGVKMGRHTPRLLAQIIKPYFSRNT